MSKFRRAQRRHRRVAERRGRIAADVHRRLLMGERLESRRLLAASPYQNPMMPEDINADGMVNSSDLVHSLSDLTLHGARALNSPGVLDAEGESGSGNYIDVNADGYVTAEDLLQVINRLMQAEAEGPQIAVGINLTDTNGNPISSTNVGADFHAVVTIQDIRDPTDDDFPDLNDDPNNLGVFAAYFDFEHSTTISTNGQFIHGDDYQSFTSGNNPPFPIIGPGLIQDLGGIQTNLVPPAGGPLGPGVFELVTIPFHVDSSGLTAVDDMATFDENGPGAAIHVLSNDDISDEVTIERGVADGVGRDVLTLLADITDNTSRRVPPNEVIGNDATLTINGVALGGLQIVSFNGSHGTPVVQDNGTPGNPSDDVIFFTPATGFAGTTNVVYSVSDGVGGTSTATATISVGSVNDPPVNNVPGGQSVPEEMTLLFNGNLSVSDLDAAGDDVQVDVSVNNGTLTFATTAGLTSFVDNSSGIQAIGSLAEVNAALNGLTYVGNIDFVGVDTLTITTNDLGHNGDPPFDQPQMDTDTVAITVTGVNDAPVNAVPGPQEVVEDEVLAFTGGDSISISDVDAGSGQLTVSLTVTSNDGDPGDLAVGTGATIVGGANNSDSITLQGTLSGLNSALAGLTYTPDVASGFIGDVVLTINTNDNGNTGVAPFNSPLQDTDTVNIEVVAGVLPSARRDRPFVREDSTAADVDNNIDVLGNDRTNVGSEPTLLNFTQPANGVVTLDDNGTPGDLTDDSLIYDPNADFFGADTFTYVINEEPSMGGLDSTGTVIVTVQEVNDPPEPVDDSAMTDEDVTLTLTGAALTSNDDPGPGESAQNLTVTGVSASSTQGGAVSVSNNVVTYTPPQDFNGTDSFVYTVTDNGTTEGDDDFLSATATVVVTINAVNDPPVANPDSDTAAEDTTLTIAASTLLSNDNPGGGADEAGQTLTLTDVSPGSSSGGTVSLDDNGTPGDSSDDIIEYLSAQDFNGTDTFTYTISDNGSPSESAQATVTIAVTPVNDDPIANPDMADGIKNMDSTISVSSLLLNDDPGGGPDEAGQPLSITGVSASTTEGGAAALVSGTNVVYTPAADFSGIDTFTYTLSDGNGGTATGTVTVDVADFVPSSFSGFVYSDSNNNGLKDAVEQSFAGVSISLTGFDLDNNPIPLQTTTTDRNGFYSFDGLVPGSYNIFQTSQPNFLLDGIDTPGNGASLAGNDNFRFDVGALGGVDSTDNNYGERGLSPGYFNLQELRATLPDDGLIIATNDAGDQFWQSFLGGWSTANHVQAQLSSDRSTVTMWVNGGPARMFNVNSDHRIRIMGSDANGGCVIRIEGTASDFGLADNGGGESEAEGEGEAAANRLRQEDLELLAQAAAGQQRSRQTDAYFAQLG